MQCLKGPGALARLAKGPDTMALPLNYQPKAEAFKLALREIYRLQQERANQTR